MYKDIYGFRGGGQNMDFSSAYEIGSQQDFDVYKFLEELRKTLLETIIKKHPELKNMMEEFKRKFSDVFLLYVSEDEFYIYRAVRAKEYNDLVKKYKGNMDEGVYELIRMCVLYPRLTNEDIDNMKAGVANKLVEGIVQDSGFGNYPFPIRL